MPKSYDKYINCLNKNGQPSYDRNQLLEIAGGLGNKLDVDKYAILNKNGEPVFDYDQVNCHDFKKSWLVTIQ